MVSRSVRLGVRPITRFLLLSYIFGFHVVWRPLWEGWVCNYLIHSLLSLARAVTLGSKSHRTHNYILMSHLRLSQPGGPGPCIYIPQEQGNPVIPLGTRFPFRCLSQLAGLWWRYSNPLPNGCHVLVWRLFKVQVILLPMVSRPVCLDDGIFITVGHLQSSFCRGASWWEDRSIIYSWNLLSLSGSSSAVFMTTSV
jgi:hypothetical protein